MSSTESINRLLEQLSFTVILDNIDVGVIVYDGQGNVVLVNTVMINWRNIPRNEYQTMNVHDFMDVIDVCVFDLVLQEKKRISRLQYYHNYQKTGGIPRVRIVTGSPIFDGQGNIQYVITMLQDVDDFQTLHRTLLEENKILYTQRPRTREEKASIVAKSPEIKQLLSVADNIAPLDSTVLLFGESGSGKEVFANYIHEHSKRKDKPIITVNCAAFPENLIEAELFGYEKGSFTGANREGKMGLAEAADGGTLFLDEINSLSLSVQGKILRMIEEKSIQRIGSVRSKRVDFRLITATNQDLLDMVHKGTFREDLYYRLNVIQLYIPPLRERPEDISALCGFYLEHFNRKFQKSLRGIEPEFMEALERYDWKGNVRELRNVMERCVLFSQGPLLTGIEASLPLPGRGRPAPQDSFPIRDLRGEGVDLRQEVDAFEMTYIKKALELTGGNLSQAAQLLGVTRFTLKRRLEQQEEAGGQQEE